MEFSIDYSLWIEDFDKTILLLYRGLFSPFYTCKQFQPALNSPRQVVLKDRLFGTLEFAQS